MPNWGYGLTPNFHSSSTSCGKGFSRCKLTLKNDIALQWYCAFHFPQNLNNGPQRWKKRFEFWITEFLEFCCNVIWAMSNGIIGQFFHGSYCSQKTIIFFTCAQKFQKLFHIAMFLESFRGWMDGWMTGLLDGWRSRHIVEQEGIRVRNRSQTCWASSGLHVALSKKTVLARVPTPYCVAQFRICMLQSPIVEECLVLHVTVSNVPRIFFSPTISSSARQHFL